MRKLLIIVQDQYGYNIDTFYFSKYLSGYYQVVYFGWDQGFFEISNPDISIQNISRDGGKITRLGRFIYAILKEADVNSIIFMRNFKGLSLILRFLKLNSCFIFDIRSGSVDKNKFYRILNDFRVKFETLFYSNVTIISESLSRKFRLTGKAHVLPLGAEVISNKLKTFDSMKLIYVGTLFNRNIDVAIKGFSDFYYKYFDKIHMNFTIIGDGQSGDLEKLNCLVKNLGLEDIVLLVGRVPHVQLSSYFDLANIGISYIPITKYYDFQPATKTYEYLLSGMPVLATKTYENCRCISDFNGVLIGDSSADFECGLIRLYEQIHTYDSSKIMASAKSYSWLNIVSNNFIPYLHSVESKHFSR